ncbi:hypothetical protein AKJ16_DCAP06169 [Drosera capensis]
MQKSSAVPSLKKKALNSWSAVQDTFYSTKDTFERHKVVLTIGTSIASVGTALIGYSLRHYHETKVASRLDAIEQAVTDETNSGYGAGRAQEDCYSRKYQHSFCAATAGTALVIGYALGWRGGRWYANRKFRREQMKPLGQSKPRRWRLQLIRRPLLSRFRPNGNAAKASDDLQTGQQVASQSSNIDSHTWVRLESLHDETMEG